MRARRRPVVFLFASLLAWLVVSSAGPRPVAERAIDVAGESVGAITLAVPRASLVVARELTRLPALTDDAWALTTVDAPGSFAYAAPRRPNEAERRAERARRIAWSHDATAPPALPTAKA